MRFPEFEGNWEERKFEDICSIKTGNKNTQDKEDDGRYPFYVRSEIIEKINSYSFDGEAILTAGDGVGVGKIFHYINEKVGVHQRVYILSDFQAFGKYVYYYFSSQFYDRVMRMSAKNSVDSVRRDMIAQMPILLPTQEEQHKIATFLTLIDKRIETQKKIIEDLESLKSAINIKLFDGALAANMPPFWKPVKLSEVLSIPEKVKPQYIDKDKLLTVKLHLNGVMKNDNTDTLSLGATNYYIRRKGQFIFGKQNIFNGAFDIIPDELDSYLSSADVPSLDINTSKIHSLFLLYYFSREKFYKPLEDIAIGSGSKRIHETTILNLKIYLPTWEEQSLIANTLWTLERKTNLELKILQFMQKEKEYFLDNMFI